MSQQAGGLCWLDWAGTPIPLSGAHKDKEDCLTESSSSHYQVLRVAVTATEKEIKVAYRRAARKAHPDHGGDAAAFRRVTAAYETLIDPNAGKLTTVPMLPVPQAALHPAPDPISMPLPPEAVPLPRSTGPATQGTLRGTRPSTSRDMTKPMHPAFP